jgi:uncharacterized RDD family membrane protein YckC
MNPDKYNTFWRRFGAGILDGLVLLPISFLDRFIKSSENEAAVIVSLFLSYSVFYFYSIIFHWQTGQTLGKKWANIRVVNVTEDKLLSFRQALIRDGVYFILELIGLIALSFEIVKLGYYPIGDSNAETYLNWLVFVWLLLELCTMLNNEKRRAFHDLMAGSVVIKEEYWGK